MLEILDEGSNKLELARNCVEALKDLHPKYSSSQLAKLVGISQSTFNRIENGQTNPNLLNISKLLGYLKSTHKISDASKFLPESLTLKIKENLSHNFENPIIGGDFASYFSKSSYRNIMLLALTKSGTTRDEIQLEYGNSGLKLLNELIEKKLLNETRGIIRGFEETVSFNQEILKQTLISCVTEKYNAEEFGQGVNWLSFQSESINKNKAMELIRSKLQKAYKEIDEEILNSPEYAGNDKVFIGMVADSLLKESDEVTQ